MTQPEYFTDRTHLLIAGVTGARTDYGGKTALANWWCYNHGRASFDLVLFCNFKHDSGPQQTADADVQSVEGVAERPCPPVGHVVACLSEGVAGVTHGREDETELLGVVRLSVGEGRRFDQ